VSNPIEALLIDDEPIVCERLKEFLSRKGVSVEAFSDSSKAVERMKQKSFDVVVTDLKMDGPTGMDVLRLIRDEHPSTRGILITAYGVIENVREAEVLEAFDIVHKPFQLEEIYKLVVKAGKASRRARPSDR
jgi:DNA-binding NtrC family response regulator